MINNVEHSRKKYWTVFWQETINCVDQAVSGPKYSATPIGGSLKSRFTCENVFLNCNWLLTTINSIHDYDLMPALLNDISEHDLFLWNIHQLAPSVCSKVNQWESYSQAIEYLAFIGVKQMMYFSLNVFLLVFPCTYDVSF